MRITDRDTDDLALAAQEREAERELVDETLDQFGRGMHLPYDLMVICERLATIKAQRAALADGGGGREKHKACGERLEFPDDKHVCPTMTDLVRELNRQIEEASPDPSALAGGPPDSYTVLTARPDDGREGGGE